MKALNQLRRPLFQSAYSSNMVSKNGFCTIEPGKGEIQNRSNGNAFIRLYTVVSQSNLCPHLSSS